MNTSPVSQKKKEFVTTTKKKGISNHPSGDCFSGYDCFENFYGRKKNIWDEIF